MFLTIHFVGGSCAYRSSSIGQFLISGFGRASRCITTALVTFVMLLIGNDLSVQTMIIISCAISMALVLLLTTNDILILREQNKQIRESLSISEKDLTATNNIQEGNLQEISEQLYISKRVVQRHITAIYEKTNRSTRIGLLQLYMNYINNKK